MTQLQEPRELLCLPRIFVNAYGAKGPSFMCGFSLDLHLKTI